MNDDLRGRYVRSAMERAGSPPQAAGVVAAVAEAAAPDEYVLEIASTTASGELTACVTTTQRLYVGEGPGELVYVDLDALTSADGATTEEGELALVMRAMDGTAHWIGFGENGLQRILHAVEFAMEDRARRYGVKGHSNSGEYSEAPAELWGDDQLTDTHAARQALRYTEERAFQRPESEEKKAKRERKEAKRAKQEQKAREEKERWEARPSWQKKAIIAFWVAWFVLFMLWQASKLGLFG